MAAVNKINIKVLGVATVLKIHFYLRVFHNPLFHHQSWLPHFFLYNLPFRVLFFFTRVFPDKNLPFLAERVQLTANPCRSFGFTVFNCH